MKRILFYIPLLALGMLLLCCKKDDDKVTPAEVLPNPKAAFSYAQVADNDPFTFKFTNQSSEFKDVRWSFGDDSTSVQGDPTHTFLKPGTYNVKLRVLNKNGDWAQREAIIKILTDQLVEFTAEKAGLGKLNLGFNTNVAIEKISWYHGKTSGSAVVSNAANLNVAIPIGTFDFYTLRLQTPNKSIIEIPKTLTDLGIVVDRTNLDNSFSISKDNGSGPDGNEGSKKLIDNNLTTKVFIGSFGAGLNWTFTFNQPQIINGYTMTTGNDAPERDPKSWVIMASNDNVNWETLHTMTGYTFLPARRASTTFTFVNSKKYFYYRFVLNEVSSGSNFQMSEFRILELPQ